MPEVVLVRSVQRRVALVSGLVASAAVIFGVIGMEFVEGIEHERMLDGRLKQLAGTILKFVDDAPGKVPMLTVEPRIEQDASATDPSIYSYQVWLTSGELLLQSPGTSNEQPLTKLNKFGFDSIYLNGELNRVFTQLSPSGSVVIQVAEPIKERSDDIRITIWLYLVTLVLPFGFSMAATWFLLRRSFRTLDTLVERMRQHHLLDAGPVNIGESSKELAPVVQAVNSLFQRTGQAFKMEQRFTSMAAHELRTPWAGIRAQAQIACNSQTQEEMQKALHGIVRGIDRASHVFDQLLDLTRVEGLRNDIASSFQRVQLSMVYQEVLEDLGSKAAEKRISMTAQIPEENIQGLDLAIYLLLRNLISNAILYTPEEGQIEVSVQRNGEDVILNVDDSGKGIPTDARSKAFERFNRLGQQGTDGVGLGLSIVAQIVELHHAEIQLLDSPLGGLRVQVVFKSPCI